MDLNSSIFSAEAIAILQVLTYINAINNNISKNVLIRSNSQSILPTLQNFYKIQNNNYITYKIVDKSNKKNISFPWCLSHTVIKYNEIVY